MIFQDPLTSLNPLYTGGPSADRNLAAPMCDMSAAKPPSTRAIELLERSGHPRARETFFINAYPHEFSGGMRQRVVIALALAA